VSEQTDRPPEADDAAPAAPPPTRPPDAPKAPPNPDPERKAPGFPGEASPGQQPKPRDGLTVDVVDVDAVTGEISTPRKTFASFLLEQRNGALHTELSEALADVVKAVQDHGKGGTVALSISIKPGAKGTSTLIVVDDVKTKVPQGERPAAMFFADEDGNLSRDDPRQTKLPLRQVDVGRGADLRRAGGEAR
jgi:hypothetical protein